MAIASFPQGAEARETASKTIDIRAGTLPDAIAELAREQRVSIGTEGSLPNIPTPAIRGKMSVDEALRRLLRNSAYHAKQVGKRAWRIERRAKRERQPQPAPSSPETTIPLTLGKPIVVTASKREKELDKLPMSLAIVRLGEHDPANASDGTAEIARSSEGLSLTNIGPGRNRMFLRGVADSAFNGESQSTVAVVLDESRITYAAPDPDLRLVDVDRVELIKGPQGSLYGTGALGGIYRIVTRKPQYDETDVTVSASATMLVDGDRGYDASLVANLPLVPENAAVRLVGYSGRKPGWIRTGERDDSNQTEVLGARGTVSAQLPGEWRADLVGAFQLLDSRDSHYVFSPGVRHRESQFAEPHDNDFGHVAFRLAGQAGIARIEANSGISWHTVRDVFDATRGATGFGLAAPERLVDDRNFRVWDSELRASGSLGGGDWLVGLTHLEARQSIKLDLRAANDNLLVLDDDRRITTDSAVFTDVSMALSSEFTIDLGARLFLSKTRETRETNIGLVTRSVSKAGLTPTFALAWTPRDGRLVFLRYGSAFRQGGADIALDGTIRPLKGDELATFELGWRETLPHGSLISLGAYYSIWENIQSDLLEPDGLFETANIGDGRISGVEGSAELRLSRDWALTLGANYTSAVRVNDPGQIGDVDFRLPVVPIYSLRGRAERRFRAFGSSAKVSVGLRYLGPAHLSFDPVVDRDMGRILDTDFKLFMRWSSTDLELLLRNLLDARKSSFAFGNPLRFFTTQQFTPQPPLSVQLSLRRYF